MHTCMHACNYFYKSPQACSVSLGDLLSSKIKGLKRQNITLSKWVGGLSLFLHSFSKDAFIAKDFWGSFLHDYFPVKHTRKTDHDNMETWQKQTCHPVLFWCMSNTSFIRNVIKHCDPPKLKHSNSKSPDTQTPAALSSTFTGPDSLVWPLSLVPTNLDHQSPSDWWTDRTDDTYHWPQHRVILLYILATHPHIFEGITHSFTFHHSLTLSLWHALY